MCSVCFCCDACCCGCCSKPDVKSAIREARRQEAEQSVAGRKPKPPPEVARKTLTSAQRCKTKVVPGGVTSVKGQPLRNKAVPKQNSTPPLAKKLQKKGG